MFEKVKVLNHSGIIGGATDPSHGNSFTSLGGVDYIIGTVFILFGLLIYVLFQRKAKEKYEQYKKDQLALYNKNRGTNVKDYNKTNLYVPFWEKAKFSAPIMLTMLFIMVGVFWIIWTATGTPISTL